MQLEAGLVGIIIVNWNGWRDTVACLDSLGSLDYPRRETIVVDNGSTDESAEQIRAAHPGVTLIETGANLGFAGGNNVGIARALEAGAVYVWLLNNDTTVDASALSELVRVAESMADAGSVGSQLHFFDRPDVIQFGGGVIDARWGFTRHIGEGERGDCGRGEVFDVDYTSGASMLVPAAVLRDVGLMREDYFLYWEEVDWCERIRSAGYRVVQVPASRVLHKVGASTPASQSPTKARYEGRNRVLFYRRNRPDRVTSVALRAFVNAAYLLLKGRPKQATALAAGVVDGLREKSGKLG